MPGREIEQASAAASREPWKSGDALQGKNASRLSAVKPVIVQKS